MDYEAESVKHVGFSSSYSQHHYDFASGVGLLRYRWGGGAGSHTQSTSQAVSYARIGGVEYGTPIVSAGEPPSSDEAALALHPNPLRRYVTLGLASPSPQRASVAVYDLLGRRVLVEEVAAPDEHRLDLSALVPGVYVVRAALADGTVLTRRVTKAR